ncbi:SSURE domain-containing protein [Streptococcus ovis]|uniref:SSURE domain-containing protein n=1 Tax=Streptococcus ovis TaxID=82806 RepID=UPI0003648B9F|nr:fibronectin-binding SSURE repeat-containing protein [Streptococcus ovis]
MFNRNVQKETGKRFTKWSLRRVGKQTASVVVASGLFLSISQPALAQVIIASQTDTITTTAPADSSSISQTTTPTTTVEAPVTSEEQPNTIVPQTEAPVQKNTPSETQVPQEVEKAEDAMSTDAVPHHDEVKNAIAHNFKDVVNVPAEWLDAAKADGPFTAGVNQIIPFELFGGDGMLTRLLLKSSDKAPWSDNGTAKHPFLLPFDKLENGKYFYEVDLDGNAAGKKDGELLAQLKENGTHSYQATVKVYAAKDGKADTSHVVATKTATINLKAIDHHSAVKKAVAHNFKDVVNVPAEWLDAAKADGPFTAGVNQIIPFELFGGDGMLTRLLLKSSDKAPWSDNGTAKHPFLLPFDKLENGKYFYEVDLDGNAAGKKDGELLAQLKENGTHSYQATVKVYAAKDGKADTSHVVATKTATINLNGIKQKAPKHDQKNEVIQPVYRLYHSGLKSHLYTTSVNERNTLTKRGWKYEGIAWNTTTKTGAPVYRLYHEGLRVHLYTKDANEYKVLGTRGWRQEGIAYRSNGEVPVYRLYHAGIKKHHYTKDANEYKVLGTRGWKQEGIAWYSEK